MPKTVLDKSKLSVDLKRDVTIAADNEDILNSEFAKIQDEAYQIFFVKNKMNKGQIYQEHNRYKDNDLLPYNLLHNNGERMDRKGLLLAEHSFLYFTNPIFY